MSLCFVVEVMPKRPKVHYARCRSGDPVKRGRLYGFTGKKAVKREEEQAIEKKNGR